MAKLTLPSFLNFNRSISPSDGFMFGVDARVADDPVDIPVQIHRRGIRSSISNFTNVYGKTSKDMDKNINSLKDPEKANLQQIDTAFLPQEAQALKVVFSVIVQANSLAPSACNDANFYQLLKRLAAGYDKLGGFDELAKRYVWNMINGRVLWRNRFVTEIQVKASFEGQVLSFASSNMQLFTFDETSVPADAEILASRVAEALRDPTKALTVTIEIVGKAPIGAEVFPSQEFVPETVKVDKKKKESRTLSFIERTVDGKTIKHATIHSQKIGNALRWIDEWHGQVDEYGATPIEAYGYVQSRMDALRLPSKGNAKPCFELLMDIENVLQEVEAAKSTADLSGDIHYLMAVLVRGGVFSGNSK